jgi:Tfp pilus assembly PilM family ATPase
VSARALGLDLTDETARFVAGRVRKGAFEIVHAGEVPIGELPAALKAAGLRGWPAMVGVTGRDMILRTTQVPPVPEWQLRELMKLEIAEVAEHAGDDLCADHGLLPGAARHGDQDFALLALVRAPVLEARAAEVARDGIKLQAFAPKAVALHDAVCAVDGAEGTVLTACIDEGTTDLALTEDGELLFARNLAGGLDLFEKAVGEVLSLDGERAREACRKLAVFPAPGEKLAGTQGTVARALETPLRQLVGMLQSTVLLCKNQLKATDLRLTRVLLCGPGASVPGLDAALTRALGVPVARFDPTDGYLVGEAEVPAGRGPAFAAAAGLALMATLPDAYRLEILTERQRKSRRFRSQTVWLVLAALLVLGHLVHAFVSARSNFERAERDVSSMRREVESRKADARTAERTAQEARELAGRLASFEDITAPGSGVLTLLDLLDATLPTDLWATSVRSQRAVEPEFARGTERRPFVTVEGSGKEQSRSLTNAVSELTQRLRADPHVAAVKPHFSTNPSKAFDWSLSVDTSVVPGGKPAAAAEGEGGGEPPEADAAPAPGPAQGEVR